LIFKKLQRAESDISDGKLEVAFHLMLCVRDATPRASVLFSAPRLFSGQTMTCGIGASPNFLRGKFRA
jgi:hypothetical protein